MGLDFDFGYPKVTKMPLFLGQINLATQVLDMLEQKVKHVLAMKFVTDQESSI